LSSHHFDFLAALELFIREKDFPTNRCSNTMWWQYQQMSTLP